jgi:hypothetical protein
MKEQAIREVVKAVYPSKRWAKRVDQMNHDQLIAVYIHLKLQGKVA